MFDLSKLDRLDKLFIFWAFLLMLTLIAHFAVRKTYFESYTLKYGWIVYAMCVPAVVVSLLMLRGGKSWAFWLGGFLFAAFAIFGYWVDYVAQIQFRNPVRVSVLIPYIVLYLGMVSFYWWPIGFLSRPLWYIYTVLFVIATVLNIRSH